MQSYNDAPSEFVYKSSIVQNTWRKGKENQSNAPTCFQPQKQKPTLEKGAPQDPPKSRLPVLSKVNQPPDFQKLHQSWQNQFQKGKAVKKKQCTRPQPFNFSQKLDRPRVATDARPSETPPGRHRRAPLAKVAIGQKNQFKDSSEKGGNVEFKADPAALASILSDVGVPVPATGKLSLAQRVPMRVSSIAQSSNICKNTMVRSSMYAVLRSQSASSNLDRISCFANMHPKVSDKIHPAFKQNPLLKRCAPDRNAEELVSSSLDDKLQSQENPVLQQMNRAADVQTSSMTSPAPQSWGVPSIKSALLHPVTEDAKSAVLSAEKHEKNTPEGDSCAGKLDPMKAGSASVKFVADSQALASILSHTGVTIGNGGKLSLAQRVPMQSKNASLKSGMISSEFVTLQATTPKPCYGRMSALAVPIKDIAYSPCRVAKTPTDKSSIGSAKRVQQLYSSAMFSCQYSTSKQAFFPKTPRALALERANKKLETELSDAKSSAKSTVKWADERFPSVYESRDREPKMGQVAVRLFLDGDCPGEPDKKTESSEESDCLKGSESLPVGALKGRETTKKCDHSDVAARTSPDLIHANVHPAAPSLILASPAVPAVQYSSIVPCMKTALPLSFLSHPVVQALQSNTLGSYSLPDIARLRIQAAVSAKQRFWETCLDEECAFYTSRGAASSFRNCIDPVSSFLERQDDLHFTPIIPGEP